MHVDKAEPEEYIVREEDVVKAVSYMKQDKSDGNKGLLSNHVINGPSGLMVIISVMLITCRRHGYMADDMLLSTIASIPKDNYVNICDSDNHRGSDLSSVNQYS